MRILAPRRLFQIGLVLFLTGCAGVPWRGDGQIQRKNPLFVAQSDRDYLWEQVVDAVDDYFPIQREERVRQVGQILVEGRIDTYPEDGSNIFEPWRKDSVSSFEKLHSTLQSTRRRAVIRVAPAEGGYWIDVAVYKELENVQQPEHSVVVRTFPRHDGSLVRNEAGDFVKRDSSGEWIPLGRDMALEQRILQDIRARLE